MTNIKIMKKNINPSNSFGIKPVQLVKHHSNSFKLSVSLLSAICLWSGGALTLIAKADPVLPIITAQIPAGTNVIYVNLATGTDNDSAGSTEQTPLRTITAALQRAQPDTVVQLANGSYTASTGEVFPIVVPRGVTLRGNPATQGQTVAIIGGANYVSNTEANQNVALLAEQDSVVTGLTITNPNTRGTGLWIQSTNPRVANNTFSKNKREGIYVTGNANPKIEGNTFINNDGQGISVVRTSQGEIRDNLFQNTGFGIALTDQTSPLIVKNRILQNVDGIVIASSATPVIRENVIEGNQRDGVVVISNAKPNLGTTAEPGGNRISNNARYDIYNATSSNTLLAYGNNFDPQRIRGRVEFANTPPVASRFSDTQGHWANAYIEALASQGIIAGFNDNTFRPSEPVTRAQFAAIINKAFTPAPEKPAINFVDVSSNFWGYQAIQTAARGGFISGYPGNKFLPNQRIPRVQVLVSLASGLKLRSDDTSVLSVYQDSSLIPQYATTAVAGATAKQLVVNYPIATKLDPNREATRAEVAAFVYQALVNAGRAQPIASSYLVKSPLTTQR
jgi:parallel beta-helix repeat protein